MIVQDSIVSLARFVVPAIPQAGERERLLIEHADKYGCFVLAPVCCHS